MQYATGSSTHVLVLLADVVWLVTVVWGVVDVVRARDVRRSDKVAWAVSIVAIPIAGVAAWLVYRIVRRRSSAES